MFLVKVNIKGGNLKVIKRDGREADFDSRLIYEAIIGANYYTEDKVDLDSIVIKVTNKLVGKDVVKVCEIQDAVEHALMVSKYKATAKKYIEYRSERDRVRETKNKWAKIGIDITSGEDTESQRENSNVPRGTVTTQVEMIKRLYSKEFANEFILPTKYKEAHTVGDIHVHDSAELMTKVFNCALIDYKYMFDNGFQLGNKWIEKPKTLITAMNVLVQVVQVQATLQFGGITLESVDEHLGEYVLGSFKKHFYNAIEDLEIEFNSMEGMELHPDDEILKSNFPKLVSIATRHTKQEVYKACKLLSYQLNTLQVRGESSPFVTIGYGTATTWEGRLLQECILQERLDEFDKSGVQEFPKHLFSVRSGVNLNKEDTNYDIYKKAMKTSAKTCYPDYIFPENQETHTGGSAYYMGCRSLLSPWENEKGEQVYRGRGNIGVCTVNLPRIAIESGKDKVKFWKLLEERLDLTAEVVKWRYNRLITLKAKEAPFTYIGGIFGMQLDPEETIEKVFAKGRGTLSIGYIGLHEVVLQMLGKETATSEEAINFQLEVLNFINSKIEVYKKDTGLGYGLYSSPSESLTDRFCKLDYAKFGSIKGITDKGFYINSYHVNTEAAIDPFTKIDIESNFQKLATGGHISTVEVNNLSGNLEAYEQILKHAHDKGLMYIGVNSPWDFCKTCHWTGELEVSEDTDYNYSCPECGEDNSDKVVLTRRLCGYLTTMNKRPPVEGRVKEIISRVKHG